MKISVKQYYTEHNCIWIHIFQMNLQKIWLKKDEKIGHTLNSKLLISGQPI